jgi:hypothetical protein
MAGLGDYEGPGQVFYQGSLLADATMVRVRHNRNGSEVLTMSKGFAGMTAGAFKSEITVENAVPKNITAQGNPDFVDAMVKGKHVRVVVVHGGKRYGYDGVIDSCDIDNSAKDAAASNFVMFAPRPKVL